MPDDNSETPQNIELQEQSTSKVPSVWETFDKRKVEKSVDIAEEVKKEQAKNEDLDRPESQDQIVKRFANKFYDHIKRITFALYSEKNSLSAEEIQERIDEHNISQLLESENHYYSIGYWKTKNKESHTLKQKFIKIEKVPHTKEVHALHVTSVLGDIPSFFVGSDEKVYHAKILII